MKYDLVINIDTHADLAPWTVGEKLLSPVFEDRRLVPERIAVFEEVTAKNGFDVEGIKECREHWANKVGIRSNGSLREFHASFNWKRRKVAKSYGAVGFADTNFRGGKIPASIFFLSQYRKEIDWSELFEKWCVVATPFAAILHPNVGKDGINKINKDVRDYTYEEEVSSAAWSRFLHGTLYCEFRAGELNSLVSGLTNLGWASFFGGEFAAEVDAATIAAAGFPVRKIGDGYLVQVTENISDVNNDFEWFSKRRAELKSLFREDLFLIKDEP